MIRKLNEESQSPCSPNDLESARILSHDECDSLALVRPDEDPSTQLVAGLVEY